MSRNPEPQKSYHGHQIGRGDGPPAQKHPPEARNAGVSNKQTPALAEALAAAKRGWRVFPLTKGSKVPLKGSRGVHDATNDLRQIHEWADAHPDCNWGLATGTASGVFVLDLDLYKPAATFALERWESDYGPLPDGPTCHTPRGGRHHLFQHPAGCKIKNNNSGALAAGTDVKGDDGYVVLAGGQAEGGSYVWDAECSPDDPVPVHPEWLDHLLRERGIISARDSGPSGRSVTHEDTCGYVSAPGGLRRLHLDPDVKAQVDQAIRATLPKRQGERRHLLNELVRRLKAIPSFSALPAIDLRPIVTEWHQLALPAIGTKSLDRSLIDFSDAWKNVREPRGLAMAGAIERASAVADDPPWLDQLCYGDAGRFAARLVRELSAMRETGQFYLGCRALADAMKQAGHDLNRNEAAGLLRVMVADGVLEIAKPAERARRQSAEYRYLPPL